MVQPLWRTVGRFLKRLKIELASVGRFLKRLKIELASDPVIPLLGIYVEENMIHYSLQHSLQQPRHISSLNIH